MTKLRLPYYDLSPEAYQALRGVKAAVDKSTIGKALVDLIFMRVSQINGCAFCLDMHGKALRAAGETAQRLDTLAAWRASPLFDARERAALGWAEAVTDIATSHAPDEAFEPLKAHFTDAEISDLTFAIVTMNAFNRLAIGMRQ